MSRTNSQPNANSEFTASSRVSSCASFSCSESAQHTNNAAAYFCADNTDDNMIFVSDVMVMASVFVMLMVVFNIIIAVAVMIIFALLLRQNKLIASDHLSKGLPA